MEAREFAKYHTWCLNKGIKVYAVTEFEIKKNKLKSQHLSDEINSQEYNKYLTELNAVFSPNNNPTLFIAKEENGIASYGSMKFTDGVNASGVTISNQIGILLKAIVYKELQLMEIKSTYNQLEGICEAAIKQDREKIVFWLTARVLFREAMLYLEAFYPDNKEYAQLIYELAHCKCGTPAVKWNKNNPVCANCSFQKSTSQIEYSKKV
jgi:hypothetical protein